VSVGLKKIFLSICFEGKTVELWTCRSKEIDKFMLKIDLMELIDTGQCVSRQWRIV
jgi:hypothetical protein